MKIAKIISYILLFVLPLIITTSVVYMLILSSYEQTLEANAFYDTEIFQDYIIDEINDIHLDMQYNYYNTKELNDYDYTRFDNINNNLLDVIILDTTNKNVFSTLDLRNMEITKENIEADITKNTYIIYANDKYTTNINISSREDELLNKVLRYTLSETYNNFYRDDKEIYYNANSISTNNIGINSNDNLDTNNDVINSNEIDTQYENIDFTIYLKISENKTTYYQILRMFFNTAKTFGRTPIFYLPIFFAIYMGCLIYVIAKAGHKNNENEIYMNIFDRIPLDLLTLINIFIFLIVAFIVNVTMEGFNSKHLTETLIYIFITIMVVLYLLVALLIYSWIITVAKRIKTKTFFKNNIIVICLKKIFNFISKVFKGIKNFLVNFYKHFGINLKAIIQLFGFTIVSMILFYESLMEESIILVLIAFWGATIYFLVKKNARFKELKTALKQIYEGNTTIKLDEEKFHGELKDISHYINDISGGFENAIEQGIKSERMKAELITNVSHDIKTPLTSIINYVDLIKKEDIKNEKVKEYIEILDSKSQRLKRLTEDLVEASKASSGNLTLEMTKINVEELLNQCVGEFKDKFDEKKLEIVINVKKEKIAKVDKVPETPQRDKIDKLGKILSINKVENLYINADSRYMYRVIENLFSNIYKYALENSRVYIDINTDDNKVIIEIKNISKDKLNVSEEELMQRFVRGDKSRTTEGSGLGISIAKSLTELQKGTFEISIDGDLFKVKLTFNLVY